MPAVNMPSIRLTSVLRFRKDAQDTSRTDPATASTLCSGDRLQGRYMAFRGNPTKTVEPSPSTDSKPIESPILSHRRLQR